MWRSRLTLLVLMLVLWAHPASAALVNSATHDDTSSTTTASTAISHTAGNLLIATVYYQQGGGVAITSLVDTAGNTWTALAVVAASGWETHTYYAWNCLGHAANSVTATLNSAPPYEGILVEQFDAIQTSADPLDQNVSATGTGSAMLTGSITTTAANELLYAVGFGAGGAPLTPGAIGGTTATFTGTAVSFNGEYRIVTGIQSGITAAMSATGSVPWAIRFATFKGAGGTTPATPRLGSLLGVGRDELPEVGPEDALDPASSGSQGDEIEHFPVSLGITTGTDWPADLQPCVMVMVRAAFVPIIHVGKLAVQPRECADDVAGARRVGDVEHSHQQDRSAEHESPIAEGFHKANYYSPPVSALTSLRATLGR